MKSKLIVLVAVGGFVISGCSKKPPSKKTKQPITPPVLRRAEKPKTKPAPHSVGQKVFTVESADEFIAAVGPDRVIRLRPGQYNLTKVRQQRLKHVFWREQHDGDDLIIRNVCNLRIEGVGDKPVRIIVNPRCVYVLGFQDVDGVELVNLELGHTPEGYCTGGVVMVHGATNIAIQKCVLFGCGMEGLTLKDTERMTFAKSTIRDCTYGIMTLDGSSKLLFRDSRFIKNEEYHGFDIRDSIDVKFENCLIEGNTTPSLFKITSSSNVELVGGRIRNNFFDTLVNRPELLEIVGTKITNNQKIPQEQ